MSSIENTIQRFVSIRTQINNAGSKNYQTNRKVFNELKTLLIESGFDLEVITIDHNDKFFTPPKDYERTYNSPDEKFKDHQGKLAALCTKAIRDLKQVLAGQNIPEQRPIIKTKIEKEFVCPPTSWKLFQNGLFWTIFLAILSLSCLGFYHLGQNSKEKENAELVNENSEKKAEIKEATNKLNEASEKLSACDSERIELERQLNKLGKK